jgi:hypothetical protein
LNIGRDSLIPIGDVVTKGGVGVGYSTSDKKNFQTEREEKVMIILDMMEYSRLAELSRGVLICTICVVKYHPSILSP